MLELEKYAADPNNEAAKRALRRYRGGVSTLEVLAITLGLVVVMSALGNTRMVEFSTRVIISYVFHLVLMFIGSVVAVKVGVTKGLRRIIQSGLQDGSILRLDQSVISLETRCDSWGKDVPLNDGDRYEIQKRTNRLLAPYVKPNPSVL